MSVVYTPAGDHVDVCDLSCHWGLCCGLFSMFPLEAVWIFMVFAATGHNVEVLPLPVTGKKTSFLVV